MRIISANICCLNLTPRKAISAVAAQGGDVTILIESTPRFARHTDRLLPPTRAAGLTRRGGMPITVHAAENLAVEDVRAHGRGWIECRVQGVLLLAVHAVAPYLPWRLRRRREQLRALADRIGSVGDHEDALAIGDFNTAHFEQAWEEFAIGAGSWRRLTPRTDRWPGTWPLGGVWAPISVDHAVTPPHLVGENGAGTIVHTFRISGSDHQGLVVDLPDVASDGVRRRTG